MRRERMVGSPIAAPRRAPRLPVVCRLGEHVACRACCTDVAELSLARWACWREAPLRETARGENMGYCHFRAVTQAYRVH